jgi:hypothetical protein
VVHRGSPGGQVASGERRRRLRSTSQGVGEATVAGAATCPNGHAGINLTLLPGTGHTVGRYDKTGEMVFSELTEETVCYDPATGSVDVAPWARTVRVAPSTVGSPTSVFELAFSLALPVTFPNPASLTTNSVPRIV